MAVLVLALTACGPASAPAGGTAAPTASSAAAAATPAATPNLFYQGKTIRILVGFGPGAAWDQWSRLAAIHLGKHIPGNPTVIVENRVGAATKLAATAVYKTEPQDGTVVAHVAQGIGLEQIAGLPGVEFDVLRFKWIGSAQVKPQACIVRADLGIKSVKDLVRGREVFMGSTGAGSTTDYIPKSLNHTIGTNFKIVTGYTGLNTIRLAFEKGEVHGYCAGASDFVDDLAASVEGSNPIGRVIVIAGPNTYDRIEKFDTKGLAASLMRDVPTDYSLAPNDEALTLLKLLYAPQDIAMPWAVGPDVPQDRVDLLREGWRKMFADPQFLAAARTQSLIANYKTGQQVQEAMRAIVGTDKKTADQLKLLMGGR
jgi:tripartite-type tricarboxylate transporter receptor subunit TctC